MICTLCPDVSAALVFGERHPESKTNETPAKPNFRMRNMVGPLCEGLSSRSISNGLTRAAAAHLAGTTTGRARGPERGCLSRSGLDISGVSELDGCESAIPRAAAETAALRGGSVRIHPGGRAAPARDAASQSSAGPY